MSFTEKASQEISNIEHLQYKHDESDLSVSTRKAHKLAHCKKRRDIFERSDISLVTPENTNYLPLKSGLLVLIFSYISMITIMLKFGQEQACYFVFHIPFSALRLLSISVTVTLISLNGVRLWFQRLDENFFLKTEGRSCGFNYFFSVLVLVSLLDWIWCFFFSIYTQNKRFIEVAWNNKQVYFLATGNFSCSCSLCVRCERH